MKQGGWIFISHSHQDIQKVRLIRNRLEEKGLEPLMFYLKCLSDEQEIEELIKREIDERDWFIYHSQVTYETDFNDGVGYRSARRITLPSVARIDGMTFFECDNLEEVTIPDSVVYMTADAFADHPDILVRCHAGSYAEGYCQRMGIRCEIIES
ncbi:MAG: hypothetical protein IJD38_01150 [Clostridia bacterium]|nr:hypothetical protein [Clostridia bacterium]